MQSDLEHINIDKTLESTGQFIHAKIHCEDINNFTVFQGNDFIKLDSKQAYELADFILTCMKK